MSSVPDLSDPTCSNSNTVPAMVKISRRRVQMSLQDACWNLDTRSFSLFLVSGFASFARSPMPKAALGHQSSGFLRRRVASFNYSFSISSPSLRWVELLQLAMKAVKE